ncbi:hypothetical protein ACWHA3_09530 [Streptomyces cyaneofuscatus]|uniref:hypothetical protein n=1 Tax=Streptomyces sp. 021-4 TaxID=2789260 RepID=UPI0039F5080B
MHTEQANSSAHSPINARIVSLTADFRPIGQWLPVAGGELLALTVDTIPMTTVQHVSPLVLSRRFCIEAGHNRTREGVQGTRATPADLPLRDSRSAFSASLNHRRKILSPRLCI